jgi:hypothetical protein
MLYGLMIRRAALFAAGITLAGVVWADSSLIKPELPFVVYEDSGGESPFAPTGWMGDTDAIVLEDDCTDNPHSGDTCIKIQYLASGWWCGVAWQYPPNDWGDSPEGYDLSDAEELTFWARGEEGGEEVEFKAGILEKDAAYPDTGRVKPKKIRLTPQWTPYRLRLKGKKDRIKTGFVWSVEPGADNITFYVDDIQYERSGGKMTKAERVRAMQQKRKAPATVAPSISPQQQRVERLRRQVQQMKQQNRESANRSGETTNRNDSAEDEQVAEQQRMRELRRRLQFIRTILQEEENGVAVPDLCQKYKMSGRSFQKWKWLLASEPDLQTRDDLQKENLRLKQLVAELMIEKDLLLDGRPSW